MIQITIANTSEFWELQESNSLIFLIDQLKLNKFQKTTKPKGMPSLTLTEE